ncbi:PAF-1-RELATED [Ceraceosorus bombacis]|uniref:PAF-1-RELATED n=1 Tax=Ceraceosorus bombacis TaxID=401625 RepID=A0A0P1B8T8_9BASI|nr:PAF-1-RELATED [Ceraceosorus bombacis]
MPQAVIVHDVLGTLFSLDEPISALRQAFSDQLSSQPDIVPELIIMDWYHAAQRDFLNLSINNAYMPISEVFKSTLPRILLQAGLRPTDAAVQKAAASDAANALRRGGALQGPGPNGDVKGFDDEVSQIMSSLQRLTPRPGMLEAWKRYEAAHAEVWGATNGGLALAYKLFEGALGQGCIQKQQKDRGTALFSCDEIEVAKPDARVYEAVRQRATQGRQPQSIDLWFVATHTWDLFAAKKAGFKTAWVWNEEFHASSAIYGEPDIIASNLDDAAKQILERALRT